MTGATGTVLVTGCAGFIGSHLTEDLLARGFSVIGVDKLDDYYSPRLKMEQIAPSLKHPRFTLHVVDLADAASFAAYASTVQPDVVVHLAAVAGVRLSLTEPARYVRANVVATQNVLDAWSTRRRTPLVFASSSSVYGNDSPAPFTEDQACTSPPSPYAATKRACELLCQVNNLTHDSPITVLRLFTVYGRRQRPDLAIRKFTTAMLRNTEIPVFGDGTMARDFTHVSDIVRGISAAMDETTGYRVVNLGNSSPVSINALIGKIATACELKPRVRNIPRPAGEMDITYADVTAAFDRWKWRPEVPIDEGLRDFGGWLRQEEAEGRNP